jgi:hypothetical protein
MPLLADLPAFEARLGRPLSGDEETRAEASLADASDLARAEGDPDWNDATVPRSVVPVVLAVARRAFDNPDGAIQKSVGDVTLSYGGGRQGATVYLTAAERRIVRRAAGRTSAGAVTLTSPYDGAATTYVAVEGQPDAPFPLL